MQFIRKASCATSEKTTPTTTRARLEIQVSGLFGVIDQLTQPLELLVSYSAMLNGKGTQTISIREQYNLQGEVEARLTHIISASTGNLTCISATRKLIDGKEFF